MAAKRTKSKRRVADQAPPSKRGDASQAAGAPAPLEQDNRWTRYREQRRPGLLKLVLLGFVVWLGFLFAMIASR